MQEVMFILLVLKIIYFYNLRKLARRFVSVMIKYKKTPILVKNTYLKEI